MACTPFDYGFSPYINENSMGLRICVKNSSIHVVDAVENVEKRHRRRSAPACASITTFEQLFEATRSVPCTSMSTFEPTPEAKLLPSSLKTSACAVDLVEERTEQRNRVKSRSSNYVLTTPDATEIVPASSSNSSCAVDHMEEGTELGTGLDWISSEDVVTLMMKNIPCSCRRVDILAAIEEVGYKQRHDFFYVPTRRNKCLGYAFISFPSPKLAEEFARAMTGYQFRHSQSGKSVIISPAKMQGVKENLKHFRTTAVMHTDAKPLFKGRRAYEAFA